MSDPNMTPYDPLLPAETPAADDFAAVTGRFEREQGPGPSSVYVFEEMSRKTKLIGLLVFLPMYFWLLPDIILQWVINFLCQTLHITDNSTATLLLNVLFDFIMLFSLLILFRGFLMQSVRDLRRFSTGHYLKWLGISYAGFFAANITASIVTSYLTGSVVSQNQSALAELGSGNPAVLFLIAVVSGPIVEELIFRGIIFRSIRPLGALPAILVSGLLFGFIHVSSYVLAGDLGELAMIIPYAVMGFSLAFIYEKRKNILLNMGVHILHNTLAMIIMLTLVQAGFY